MIDSYPGNGVMRLYKYQPLIEIETDTEEKEWCRRLARTLNQEIWLHPLSDFNDPFERHFKYISDPKKALKDQRLFDHLHDFYEKYLGSIVTPEQFKDILPSPEFRELISSASKKMINPFFSQHGVFCLTSNPSNIPMWAHYANNHRGYCIVLEIKIADICKIMEIPDGKKYFYNLLTGKEMLTFRLDTRNIEFAFTKVVYSKTPPVIHLDKFLDIIDIPNHSIKYLIRHSIGVKYEQWKYEDEYRLVANINSKDSGLLNLRLTPFLKVSGIIMGNRLTKEEKNFFHKLCNQYQSRLYQAKCSETDYKITQELIQDYAL